MTQATLNPALGYLAKHQPLPFSANVAVQITVMLVKFQDRHRSRIALSRLGDHHLADIGLTRDAATQESRRAFWRV